MMEISEIKIEKEDEYDLETEIKVEKEEIQYQHSDLFLVPEVEEIKQEPVIIHKFEITEIQEETSEVQASSLPHPKQSKSPEGELACFYCDKIYLHKESLRVHFNSQHPGLPYKYTGGIIQCRFCKEVCDDFNALKKHVLENHPIPIPDFKYECVHCGKRWKSLYALREHMVVHSKERPHQCPICLKTFKSLNHRKDHQRTVHVTENLFKCPECPKTFKSRKQLNSHRQVHSVSRDFKCTECEKSFKRKLDLRRHIVVCHTDAKFPCKVCGKVFNSNSNLWQHTTVFHKSHQKPPEEKKPFECSVCYRSFNYAGILKNHMLTHIDKKPFKCQICPKEAEGEVSFRTNAGLQCHLNSCHYSKTYPCSICSKTFSSSSNLNSHMIEVHSALKPHECRICGKTFENNRELNCHIQTHKEASSASGEIKPQTGSVCLKTYRSAKQLRIHAEQQKNEAN